MLSFVFSVTENTWSLYRRGGEVLPGEKGKEGQVVADITTTFTILLAIFFPSVTGKVPQWHIDLSFC